VGEARGRARKKFSGRHQLGRVGHLCRQSKITKARAKSSRTLEFGKGGGESQNNQKTLGPNLGGV